LHYQYGSDKVEVLAGDVSDFSLAKKAVELAIGRWGRLDALVVNHGGLDPVKKVADSTPEEWRSAFDVNVFSAVGLVSYFLFLIRFFFWGSLHDERARRVTHPLRCHMRISGYSSMLFLSKDSKDRNMLKFIQAS
jgi:NAD(P)-dependent dehydrogenase (short-subunit alcohol dehydrogenase family)